MFRAMQATILSPSFAKPPQEQILEVYILQLRVYLIRKKPSHETLCYFPEQ
jgi:hypothetical protein